MKSENGVEPVDLLHCPICNEWIRETWCEHCKAHTILPWWEMRESSGPVIRDEGK